MGLFDKWMKLTKRSQPQPPETPAHSQEYINMLSRCFGIAHLRQTQFSEYLGEYQNWNVDLSRCIILFDDREFSAALLGSESMLNNTWLWGHKNSSGYAQPVIQDVQDFCESNFVQSIADIQSDSFDLDDLVKGHYLASMISVLHGPNTCYYRCPYDGGAAFVLVKNLPEEIFRTIPPQELITVIYQIIGQGIFSHRPLVEGLLETQCSRCEWEGSKVTGHYADGTKLDISFDDLDRISKITTSIHTETVTE